MLNVSQAALQGDPLAIEAFEYEVLIPEFTRKRLQSQVGETVTLHTVHYLEGNPTQGRLTPRLAGIERLRATLVDGHSTANDQWPPGPLADRVRQGGVQPDQAEHERQHPEPERSPSRVVFLRHQVLDARCGGLICLLGEHAAEAARVAS